ncbi:MAG: sugar transferase [Phenylobacterium sp.]|jgi:putative colanic acid biosysnthesis UDP-glucose lipid carrier transferase|uniref:sugar transferase n=1 Tax=Phenylobacterium sp. TaxID=1871053 RepID=UPI00391BB1D9
MPSEYAVLSALEAHPDLEAAARRLRGSRIKRLIDIFGALFGLIFLAPMLALVTVLICLESRGGPIFRQRRTGCDGKTFVIYKFRTMTVAEDGEEVVQARRGDSRITPLGSFLRRSSIDELPQLVNVLRGDMSLVGPRPHAIAHDRFYGGQIPAYTLRFEAKPGLTGLAQVSGFRGGTEDVALMAARVDRDLEYIRTWSIWLDLRILLRTLWMGPFDPSAY